MSQAEQIKFPTGVCFIPSQGIIKSNNTSQKLNHSEQNILNFLVEHHHHPVSKDALLKAGWPNRDITEASLFQVIRALRIKLQESYKGEVLETFPRVGYQLRSFEIAPVTEAASRSRFSIAKLSRSTLVLLGVIFPILAGSAFYWLSDQNHIDPKSIILKTDRFDHNEFLVAAEDDETANELFHKLKTLYNNYNALYAPSTFSHRRIFLFKNENIYSIAWCQMDENKTCIANTDISYNLPLNNWPMFQHDFLAKKNMVREQAQIQTEFSGEPQAVVYLNYMDDSSIRSKVVQYFVSIQEANKLAYSSMSFISEKSTPLHQILSIKSAFYKAAPNTDNQHINVSLRIKPDLFHWAYQPDSNIVNKRSLALIDEKQFQKALHASRELYNHSLYHQDHLTLMFSELNGFYWLHNHQYKNALFQPTID
ncbi:winged helix-turn-helix domain-containing protein [Photobacterium kagoshimensis]|uniref:winged helix-turn-helix domain-containing protein n=1 Tax=Photobacterium kagoshimensis TaxID=2910242 RepID=UPI003D0FFFFC